MNRLPVDGYGSASKSKMQAPPPAIALGRAQRLGLVYLSLLAFAVGIITGLGAVLFRALISLIHNVLFLGQISFHYDANIFTPASPWGPLVILVPVIGGLAVTFLVSNFAPEAKGHGVPEVMDAIYYRTGIIRPVVAVVKSLASAISIGSGAAVGREGPIIQIGSALGSTFGQIVNMLPSERIILVASGAAAGIAATFNTPIGGVLFAIEIMMPEVSARTFMPVAIATGTATFIGQYFFGPQPAFNVPGLMPLQVDAAAAAVLCLYAVLGAITGLAAAGFVRGLHWVEDLFDKIGYRYARHVAGMTIVGILFYALHQGVGHYFVEGVGYSTIQAILLGQLTGAWLLFLLFFCKLAATSLSLGSGSSGGIFSPSLFMGATIGGAFATALSALPLPFEISIPSFAMVGMGAMVGGGTGALMTAVTMIFEMTRNYAIVLPLILAVAMSVGVRRLLSRENIYTAKLKRRGHVIPKALHANMFLIRPAKEVMETDVVLAPGTMTFEALLRLLGQDGRLRHIVVYDENRIVGVLRVNTAFRAACEEFESVTLAELASRRFTIVRQDDVVFDVMKRLGRKGAIMALVIRGHGVARPKDVEGVITKEHVADSVVTSLTTYA
jgi:chloride channel protein, CIC family